MLREKGKFRLLTNILLSLNIITLLGMIFSIISSIIPPSVFPYFSIFGLIYPTLLFINLAFVVIWLIFRSKFFILSILVILAGYKNLSNNFQLFAKQSTVKDVELLKIYTNNVKVFGVMDNKPGKLIGFEDAENYIKSIDPNIICLQEYFSNGITRYGPLEMLKKTLNAKTYYFESYIEPKANKINGLVTFSKFPIVNTSKLKFPVSRTFGIATDLLIGDDTIRVYNIHLASIALNPDDIDFVVTAGQDDRAFSSHAFLIYSKLYEAFLLREKQIKLIAELIKSAPYPVILAGDFNDTPSSYVYAQIADLLEDTFKEKGRGFSITFAGQIPFLRIDYIMKSDYFSTVSYQRHKVDFSDHYPVSAVLEKKNLTPFNSF